MPTGVKKVPKTGQKKNAKEKSPVTRRKRFPSPESSGSETDQSNTDEPAALELDNNVKAAIERQIGHSLRSPNLIKQIAQDVCKVIATSFEEKITKKVYDAVSLDMKKHSDEIGALEKKVTDMRKEIKLMKNETDDAEQYSRRNCLRIYGLPEGPDEKTDDLVLDVFNAKLGLGIPREAIDRSHRITPRQRQDGNRDHDPSMPSTSFADAARRRKPRAVIVRFSRYNARNEVYRARTKLKDVQGPKIYIREDLTSKRATLYWELVNSKKTKTCWTQDGSIFALTRDSKKVRISDAHDIENL